MKYTTTLLLAAMLGAGAFTAYAEPSEDFMEKRMERMSNNLELNEQQQQQLQEIVQTQVEQRKAMRESHADRVKSILTPEQQVKFDEQRAQRKAKRQNKHENRKNCSQNKGK